MAAVHNPGARPTTLPTFALYGEADAPSDAEFVHIEDIESRSRRYHWEIDEHTHRGLFQVVFILDGGARVRVDTRDADIAAPAAIVVPPAAVHAFQFRPQTHGYVLTLAESLLFEGRDELRPLIDALFVESRIVTLAGDDTRHLAALLEQLAEEFRWPQPGRPLMFEALVQALLLRLARPLAAGGESDGRQRGRAETFARFRALVETHFRDNWDVARYAGKLAVSESRLNRLCRRLADRSAFDLIQERLLLEAKRRLIYVAAPVASLAYELGFQDPAYFCRFFKKMTGLTPTAYRRGHRPV